jgi:hypothetical protein
MASMLAYRAEGRVLGGRQNRRSFKPRKRSQDVLWNQQNSESRSRESGVRRAKREVPSKVDRAQGTEGPLADRGNRREHEETSKLEETNPRSPLESASVSNGRTQMGRRPTLTAHPLNGTYHWTSTAIACQWRGRGSGPRARRTTGNAQPLRVEYSLSSRHPLGLARFHVGWKWSPDQCPARAAEGMPKRFTRGDPGGHL